jgi:hypothetical protein
MAFVQLGGEDGGRPTFFEVSDGLRYGAHRAVGAGWHAKGTVAPRSLFAQLMRVVQARAEACHAALVAI